MVFIVTLFTAKCLVFIRVDPNRQRNNLQANIYWFCNDIGFSTGLEQTLDIDEPEWWGITASR